MSNELYLITMTMEDATQVQAFINYIELTTARLESMDDYESWIALQDIMEWESDSE